MSFMINAFFPVSFFPFISIDSIATLYYTNFYYVMSEALYRALSPSQYHFQYCPVMAALNISKY